MECRMKLTLSDFDYALPADLIAQEPARERTSSRLLHVTGGALADLYFRDLPELIAPCDLIVLNDTRVIRARVFGRKTTGGRKLVRGSRSEEHTSELQSRVDLVCRLLVEKKKIIADL